MQVNREQEDFKPVTIIVETQDELNELHNVLMNSAVTWGSIWDLREQLEPYCTDL